MATEKRMIDASDALEQLKQAEKEMMVVTPLGCKAVDIKAVFQYIESRPTVDAVSVIRCKDCKHYHADTLSCDFTPHEKYYECPNWYEDDFCSYGERKDND